MAYLHHIYEYYHFYLKYYANFNWVCSVGTCIVDVLILNKHRHTFCQLKNSRRLFVVKLKANTPSVVSVFGWQCIVFSSFLLIHIVSL